MRGSTARWFTIALLVLVPGGCTLGEDLLHMQSLRVVSHEPAHRLVSAAAAGAVAVVFSRPAHRVATENAFSLENSRGVVTGRFSWNGRGDRLEFRPHHGFEPGERYTARVTTSAEDRRGNALDRELVFSFLLRGHDIRPAVVNEEVTLGPNGEFLRLAIEFSQPMARDRMIAALSVTPAVRFTIAWLDEDRRFALTPSESLLPGTAYSFTISATAACRDGNALGSDHVVHVSSPGVSRPEIVSVTTDPGGITLRADSEANGFATDRFILTFAAPVPPGMRQGIVSFVPSVVSILEWNDVMDTVTVTPRQRLMLGQRYEIRVGDRRFPFRVTGPMVPSLSGLAFSADLDDTIPVPVDDGATVTLIPGAPLTTRTDRAVVDVGITHSANSIIPVASFLQSLRLAARNGTFAFTVRAVERDPPDSPLTAWNSAGSRGTVMRAHLTITRTGIEPLDIVTMELRAGLTDDLGNRLAAPEGRLINAR